MCDEIQYKEIKHVFGSRLLKFKPNTKTGEWFHYMRRKHYKQRMKIQCSFFY